MNGIDNEELMTNIAISVAETSLKNAWSGITKFFKDLSAKDAIRYKTAYERYLINTKSRKNTFLVLESAKSRVIITSSKTRVIQNTMNR